jgi:type I restriction enzyme R subunit
LIEKFIQENLPQLENTDDINEEFEKFWSKEQVLSFEKLINEENLSSERTELLIEDYLFGEREPMRDEILALIDGEPPTLLERKKIGDRILSKLMAFVETFINNMGDK